MHVDPTYTTTHGDGGRTDLPSSSESKEDRTAGGSPPDTGGRTDSYPPAATAHRGGAPDEQPASLGRYKVVSFLGRGGFGTVYLGHDDQLDRPVAIKVPHRELTAAAAEKFLPRGKAGLARLRHPGIVIVHDVGVEGKAAATSSPTTSVGNPCANGCTAASRRGRKPCGSSRRLPRHWRTHTPRARSIAM